MVVSSIFLAAGVRYRARRVTSLPASRLVRLCIRPSAPRLAQVLDGENTAQFIPTFAAHRAMLWYTSLQVALMHCHRELV